MVQQEVDETRGVTETVARFACAPVPGHEDAAAATRSLVDTVGVALAARDSEPVLAVRRWVESEGGTGSASPWGGGAGRSPSTAALLNGTAGHALDFDDACPSMPLHPSTVLWPALLAQIPDSPDAAVRLVAAVDTGNAVMRALGEVLPMDVHYGRGWHSTATLGRLAGVAALATLHGLTVDEARHALGLVASTAAGSLANFGTGTKPLHAGLAARDVVMAVGLVRQGLDANPEQLERPSGFLDQYGRPGPVAVADLGDRLAHWRSAWVQDWSIKRYPSCYGTHRPVDAVLGLRERMGPLAAEQVAAITVRTHPGGLRPLRPEAPRTGTEAKFSMEYTTARALTRGSLGLAAFTDAAAADPTVTGLAGRVEVVGDPTPPGRPDLTGEPYGHVRVELTDGRTEEQLVQVTRGDARNPLDEAEVDAKFHGCVTAAGWTTQEAQPLLAGLRRALTGPPDHLADALTAVGAAPAGGTR